MTKKVTTRPRFRRHCNCERSAAGGRRGNPVKMTASRVALNNPAASRGGRQLPKKLILLLALFTQGCLSPVSLPEIHQHQLTTNLPTSNSVSKTSQTLFVNLPHATQPYNTTQMVYSQNPHEICWFAQNRWAAPLPQMLLPLMLQSMRNAHHFTAVVGFPTVANTDYRLDTSVITFKQEFCGEKSRVHIVLDTTLILSETQQVIATHRIEVFMPTTCKTPESAVEAYQRALNKVLDREDYYLAVDIMKRVRKGQEKIYSASEVRKDLGLGN